MKSLYLNVIENIKYFYSILCFLSSACWQLNRTEKKIFRWPLSPHLLLRASEWMKYMLVIKNVRSGIRLLVSKSQLSYFLVWECICGYNLGCQSQTAWMWIPASQFIIYVALSKLQNSLCFSFLLWQNRKYRSNNVYVSSACIFACSACKALNTVFDRY